MEFVVIKITAYTHIHFDIFVENVLVRRPHKVRPGLFLSAAAIAAASPFGTQ